MKKMIKTTCQFWITSVITAWLWRRRGRDTMRGRIKHINSDGSVDMGYYVTGVARPEVTELI